MMERKYISVDKFFTKKKYKVYIALIIVFAVIYATYERPQSSGEIPDCEALAPVLAEADFNGWDNDENTISLSDKQKIAYHKYGFRKKLVVKEPTVLTQYIWEDGSEKNLHYGIYRDEQLTKAISEVDMGYNRKASGAMEEGAEEKDYPKYQEMIIETLERGTYYIGVYTINAKDEFDFAYRSQYCTLQEVYQLKENQEQHFFICKSVQETFFKIEAASNQKIEITSTCETEDLQLCHEDFSLIETLEKKESGKGNLYTVEFPKEGIYYLKHTGELDLHPSNKALNPCCISYHRIYD